MDFREPGDWTRYDAAIFIYNLGVIVSTPVLYGRLGLTVDTQFVFLAASLVLAAGWTAYFNISMRGKLQPDEEA